MTTTPVAPQGAHGRSRRRRRPTSASAASAPAAPARAPEALVQLARGPHSCPWCEAPTWAEPPAGWNLRDYVVRCAQCERGVQVRVQDPRYRAAGRTDQAATVAARLVHRMAEEPATPRDAFIRRTAAAAVPVVVIAVLAAIVGLPFMATLVIAALAIVPASMLAPDAADRLVDRAVARLEDAVADPVRARSARGPVRICRARRDQVEREERLRERELAANPEAVLDELREILSTEELERLRGLAEVGEISPRGLDDLLRYRRSWHGAASA